MAQLCPRDTSHCGDYEIDTDSSMTRILSDLVKGETCSYKLKLSGTAPGFSATESNISTAGAVYKIEWDETDSAITKDDDVKTMPELDTTFAEMGDMSTIFQSRPPY